MRKRRGSTSRSAPTSATTPTSSTSSLEAPSSPAVSTPLLAAEMDANKSEKPASWLRMIVNRFAVSAAAAMFVSSAAAMFVLGVALDRRSRLDDFVHLAGVSALLGLAASPQGAYLDGGSDAATASLIATVAATALNCVRNGRKRGSGPWLLGTTCLGAATCYAIVAAARLGAPARSRPAVTVGLAIALPLLHALRNLKVWRYASPESAVVAERRLLSKALNPSKVGFTQGDACGVHYIRIERVSPAPGPSDGPPLVILHGYMAGAGLFLWQFEELAQSFGVVYAVDWPGCGASARAPFTASGTDATEAWAMRHFESWRESMGIPRFVLFGHSLGGYLGAVYAMAHPHRVAHLLLVSPAGVPDGPIVDPKAATGGMVRADPRRPGPRVIPSYLWGLLSWLWNHDFTPGVMMRLAGPLGPWLAFRALGGRKARWTLEKPLDPFHAELAEYMYNVIASDGSGEFMLRHLLAPGVWAIKPIGSRLVAAARSGTFRVPVLLVYGSTHDWMTKAHGDGLATALRGAGVHAVCDAVGPAGHHVYLEAPTLFNALIAKEVRRVAAAGWGGAAQPSPSVSERHLQGAGAIP